VQELLLKLLIRFDVWFIINWMVEIACNSY
jgi:hypothetical protein